MIYLIGLSGYMYWFRTWSIIIVVMSFSVRHDGSCVAFFIRLPCRPCSTHVVEIPHTCTRIILSFHTSNKIYNPFFIHTPVVGNRKIADEPSEMSTATFEL